MTGWRRLRIAGVEPSTVLNSVIRAIDAIETSAALSDEQRQAVLSLLRALRNTPKALQAIGSRGRGRPRSDEPVALALDYLAQKELLGKAAAAAKAVADAWSTVLGKRVKEKRVTDAYTDSKIQAQYELADLVDLRIGRFRRQSGDQAPEYWTRRELLEAVSLDIRDQYRVQPKPRRVGRKKSR